MDEHSLFDVAVEIESKIAPDNSGTACIFTDIKASGKCDMDTMTMLAASIALDVLEVGMETEGRQMTPDDYDYFADKVRELMSEMAEDRRERVLEEAEIAGRNTGH